MSAETAGRTPACQLYVMLEAGPRSADLLAALLAAMPLTSVLLAPPPGGSLTAAAVRPLVEMAQKRQCAALLAEDAALARTLRADGVHLSPGADLAARYDEARSILGTSAIVGIDAGTSRHLAMELGEAGADYIAFSVDADGGVPADVSMGAGMHDGATGDVGAVDTAGDDMGEVIDDGPKSLPELIAWWSEVFEIPGVAFGAVDVAGARALALAGADFVVCRLQAGRVIGETVKDVLAWRDATEAR
jgi:thiamine-phosphate pyrophosphorylase